MCCSHQQPIDSVLALKYSLCKTPAAYAKVLSSLQHALGLHALITTKELALQHGCIQANELAKRVLQTYKEAMSGGGAGAASSEGTAAGATAVATPSIPAALLSTRSIYPCVAFYLSCRLLKLGGVDKKRLLQTAQCSDREFTAVIESFRSVMPELRPKEVVPDSAAAAAAGAGKKRKKKSASSSDEVGAVDADADADADALAESSPDLSGGVELSESAPQFRSSNGSGDVDEEESKQAAGKKVSAAATTAKESRVECPTIGELSRSLFRLCLFVSAKRSPPSLRFSPLLPPQKLVLPPLPPPLPLLLPLLLLLHCRRVKK